MSLNPPYAHSPKLPGSSCLASADHDRCRSSSSFAFPGHSAPRHCPNSSTSERSSSTASPGDSFASRTERIWNSGVPITSRIRHADPVHPVQGLERAPEAHEVAGPRAVAGRSHVHSFTRCVLEPLEVERRANPGSRVRMHEHAGMAIGSVGGEARTAAARRREIRPPGTGSRPVGRQVGVQRGRAPTCAPRTAPSKVTSTGVAAVAVSPAQQRRSRAFIAKPNYITTRSPVAPHRKEPKVATERQAKLDAKSLFPRKRSDERTRPSNSS